MMAYTPSFHGVPGNFSFTPSSTSSSAAWAHEADFAPNELPPPESFLVATPLNSYPLTNIGSGSGFEYSHRLGKRRQSSSDDYVHDAHGTSYHSGKVWDSASLQERYDASAWVTTSSSDWTVNNAHAESPTMALNYDYSTPQVQSSPLPNELGPSFASFPPVWDNQKGLETALEAPPILVPSHGINLQPSVAPAPRPPRLPIPTRVPRSPKPMCYVAHLPVPPEQQSSYSELMPNVVFLQKLREEELQLAKESAAKPRPLTITIPKPSRRTPPTADGVNVDPHSNSANLPSPAKKRKRMGIAKDSSPAETGTAQDTSTRPDSSGGGRNTKEPRKPSLACTFCRERKISCGRPPPGSPDPTCNQCARRSFKCTYMTEHNGKQVKSLRR